MLTAYPLIKVTPCTARIIVFMSSQRAILPNIGRIQSSKKQTDTPPILLYRTIPPIGPLNSYIF